MHTKGYWHRVAHVWIINSDNKVLCQKRSLRKDRKPGLWEPFLGGHLEPGQTYLQGGIKEVSEELGIAINSHLLRLFEIFKSERSKEFQAVFMLRAELNISKLNVEDEEVAQLMWVSLTKLNQIIGNKDKNWSIPIYTSKIISFLKS